MSVSIKSRYVINTNYPKVMIGDELALLNYDTGKYFILNDIGAEIWTYFSEAISVEAVVNDLMTKFKVDLNTCTDDVISFINTLVKANLLLSAD